MADEETKPSSAEATEDKDETQEEAVKEPKQKESKADSSSEASAKEEEPKEDAKAEEKAPEAPVEEVAPKAETEPEPAPSATEEAPADKEPPSPISKEMQDTSNHKGKMIGGEDVKAGMTVRVHERILDISPKGEERERIQVFEGIVLGVKGAGNKRTITVRKVSGGIGVEKVFPLASPNVTKIEVVKVARVRQAKLGFLRNAKRRFKRKLKETWMK